MHGEEPDEVVHPLVHRSVERGELGEVLADAPLLLGRLLEQPLRHDVGHVLAGDAHLLEAVLDPSEGLRDELEARVVEEALLDAGDEAEAGGLADLAHLTEEVEVEDELLLLARAQVVEKLVQHQQEPLVRVLLLERIHHLDEGVLVVGHLGRERELVGDAEVGELVLDRGAEDVPERHRSRADLGAQHLEPAGYAPGLVRDERVGRGRSHLGVLRDGRDDGHQVRLARAVVADDEQPLVVRRLVELELPEREPRELLGHPLGDHEGLDEAPGLVLGVRLAELNHRLDGFELDELRVLHADFSCSFCGPSGSRSVAA